MNTKRLSKYSTEELLDCLPQNRPLYKDSGLWQVRTDDMESVFIQQRSSETFRQFIIRYIEFLNEHGEATQIYTDLILKDY